MRAASLAVAFATALSCSQADAQDSEVDCRNALAQQEMNICAHRDYEAADKELNEVWKEARAAARDMDGDWDEEAMKGAEKALVAGQRGWIAYRDGHCELAGWQARGGSMEPMLVSGCLAELTRRRTAELRAYASGESD